MSLRGFKRILKFDDGVAVVSVHKTAFGSASGGVDTDKLLNASRKFSGRCGGGKQLGHKRRKTMRLSRFVRELPNIGEVAAKCSPRCIVEGHSASLVIVIVGASGKEKATVKRRRLFRSACRCMAAPARAFSAPRSLAPILFENGLLVRADIRATRFGTEESNEFAFLEKQTRSHGSVSV